MVATKTNPKTRPAQLVYCKTWRLAQKTRQAAALEDLARLHDYALVLEGEIALMRALMAGQGARHE